jgi:hypothetical protein
LAQAKSGKVDAPPPPPRAGGADRAAQPNKKRD